MNNLAVQLLVVAVLVPVKS